MAQRFKAKTLLSNSGVFNNEVIAPNLVYNTGNQTISGFKTFAAADNNIVISGINDAEGLIKSLSSNLTIEGANSNYGIRFGDDGTYIHGYTELNDNLYVEKTGIFEKVIANNLIYNTGNQTISGVKTFTEISCLKNATLSGDVINKNYADENLVKYIDNTLFNNTNLDLSFPTGLSGIKKINYTLRNSAGWGVNYNNITWLTSAPPNPTVSSPVVFEYYPSGSSSTQSYGMYMNAIADLEKNRSTIVYTTGNQSISGNKTFLGNLVINNLTVTGTESIVNTSNVNIGSNYLLLNVTGGGGVHGPASDGGIFFITGSGFTGINDTGAILGYDSPTNKWVFGLSTRNSDLALLNEIASVSLVTSLSGRAVFTSGNQTISGNKTLNDSIFLNSGLAFLRLGGGNEDVDIDLLIRPFSTTRVSIGTETGLLGQSINTSNFEREIKIWETGAFGGFYGPFVRIGRSGVLISEKTESKVGIGTLYPTEKVHISGGNLRVENNIQVSGTGIFNALDLNNIDNLSLSGVDITITSGTVALTNPLSAPNLVYNTGNQSISGTKTFSDTGSFNAIRLNKNRFLSYDYETGNFNITDYVTIVNCALTGSGDFATGVLPSGNISGFNFFVKNINACPVVITGSGNYTIDNTPNLYIYSGESVELLGVTATNLTGWYTMNTNLGAV